MADLNIKIIGAGVIGLTTAIELKKQYPNLNISIISDKFYRDTTSYVAAGIFRPSTNFSGPTEQITRQWINDSYNYWDEIRDSLYGAKAGIAQISGYIFSSEHPDIVRNSYIEELVPLYRKATRDELNLCSGGIWKYGSFFTTLLIECDIYLPWCMEKFQNFGGKIIKKKIYKFSDIFNGDDDIKSTDIIINCTGLGAKKLCNDKKLVPIRGQLLKVKAPWIKTFFYADYDTYIIPGFESVTLGGCRQYESYDLNINRYDGLSIMENCEKFLPSLKGATLLEQRVGLRPHRTPVRVEKEIIQCQGGKQMKIVHNYGHGGYGVTTAPGTALHAVKLVKEFHLGNSKL